MDLVKYGSRDGATVRKLDEFPQLLEALHDGDLLTRIDPDVRVHEE